MKKKIGDLTLREVVKICEEHYFCQDCQLNNKCIMNSLGECKVSLDKEIEVEDEIHKD